MIVPRTPHPDDSDAVSMAKKISESPELFLVAVAPDKHCQFVNCFHNVEKVINRHGGQIVYGWAIWKNEFFIEAEFHAVWKNGDKLVDVTPRPLAITEVLFFEDKLRKFEGVPVNNVRQPLKRNRALEDLLRLYDIRFYIENYGENRFVFSSDQPSILKLPEDLIQVRNLILTMIPQLEVFICAGNSFISLCFCGRPQLYGSCHSPNIKQMHDSIKFRYEAAIVNGTGQG